MSTNQTVLWEEVWKRTPNTKVFHLADGSKQAVIFPGPPVHYEDENGVYQNIDTALQDEADFDVWDFPINKYSNADFATARRAAIAAKRIGNLDRDLFDYQGLNVPFFARLPRVLNRGYSIGKGSDRVTIKPTNVSPARGYITQGKDNEIAYQDPWNDTDVMLAITERGIKETIILKTSKAPTTFTFELEGNFGEDVQIEPAWLEDANGVQREVQQVFRQEADTDYLDIIVDVENLAFPIMIDPTVSIQPSGTSNKDLYIWSLYPTQRYQNVDLYIGVSTDFSEIYRSLIEFDVSAIPSNTTIVSALLQFTRPAGGTSDTFLNVYRNTQAWNEGTVTWNNSPTYDETPISVELPYVSGNTPFTVDIAEFIQGFVDGIYSNYGFTLTGNESSLSTLITFRSGDYSAQPSHRPKLTIVYNERPSAPELLAPNGGEEWNAEHLIGWEPAVDVGIEEVAISQVNGTGGTTITATQKAGQTFTVDFDAYITAFEFKIYKNVGVAGPINYMITGTTNGLPDESNVYASGTMQVGTTSDIVKVSLPAPFKVPVGTVLAIFFIGSIDEQITFITHNTSAYANGNLVKVVSDVWNSFAYDAYFKIYKSEQTPQNNLQYQIQLSTDNGANYHDIVALTSAGATSYEYDFIDETESDQCLIRIRAYDGVGYGPWDVSDATFTIVHNQAPTAPTNLSPSSSSQDRAQVIRLSWQHNDPDLNPQSKYDLMYSVDAGSNWTTVSEATTNQYKDIVGGTFAKGNVIWKVRTYDQADLSSPYSSQATFFAGDKPAAPIIIEPTSNIAARPQVTWSSSGQVGYQLRVKDVAETIVYDTGEITSTNKFQQILYDLENNSTYTIEVRIKNADGLWSDYDTETITTDFTEPATPTITLAKGTGFIHIAVTNPTPTGTEPTVTSNDVYRRILGEATWIRIATGVENSEDYIDYAVASGVVYEYKVRARGDNGTYKDSDSASESITLRGVWLHDVTDPAGTVHNFKWDGRGKNTEWKPEAVVNQFAGRKNASVEFGETEEEIITAQLEVQRNSEDYAMLNTLIKSKPTLCYRDGRGRKMFGVVLVLPWKDLAFGYNTTIQVVKTSYSEVV